MTPELYAAMIQRLSLQLVNGLNGPTVNADAVVKHIEQMYALSVELRQALKNAAAEAPAEQDKPN